MAAEVLVGDQLTPEMTQAGAELLRAADRLGLATRAAFWMHEPEQRTWRYVLVSSETSRAGPRAVYGKINAAAKQLPANIRVVPTSVIFVLDEHAGLYQLLKRAIHTPQNAISGIRFSGNVINGRKVEDTYIYRMA